jgi:hypothetical protein
MFLLSQFIKKGLLLLAFVLLFSSLIIPAQAQTLDSTTANLQPSAQLAPSGDVICGGPCPLFDGDFDFDRDSIAVFLIAFSQFLTFVGVALAVIFLVFAGIQYIFGKEEEAKKNIITTVIGLVIIIVAYTFVFILANFLQSNALGDAIGGGNF